PPPPATASSWLRPPLPALSPSVTVVSPPSTSAAPASPAARARSRPLSISSRAGVTPSPLSSPHATRALPHPRNRHLRHLFERVITRLQGLRQLPPDPGGEVAPDALRHA